MKWEVVAHLMVYVAKYLYQQCNQMVIWTNDMVYSNLVSQHKMVVVLYIYYDLAGFDLHK
jgi:hypothetical protein